jgi:hypothetical protein
VLKCQLGSPLYLFSELRKWFSVIKTQRDKQADLVVEIGRRQNVANIPLIAFH